MHPKQFALIGGILMLLFGIAALIPGFSTTPAEAGLPILNFETSYGLFLGLFPMNLINKLALILFGGAGIYSANLPNTNLPASINFSRAVFFVMGAAAILGFFPATSTFFGYWPLFGGEIAVHAVFAAFGVYFGFVLSSTAKDLNQERFSNDQRRAG